MLPVLFQQDLRQTEDSYYLLYACILCCLSYSNCVFFVMFISSNVNIHVAGILWIFDVWWYYVFCQLHSVVGITSCPLHGKCAVDSAKCYICFSYRFREMYVSIARMYLSQFVSLFSCHFSASISVPLQLVDHATKLGQNCFGDKICYSRDALLSLNTSISSTSNSMCHYK